MKKLGMVIDHQKCVGCGACIIACKIENNLPDGILWSNKITETKGVFPNVRYHYIPTLCNHCEDAPCVEGCPTTAMYKDENGATLHDPDKCIGCKYCMYRCPYGVISYNWGDEFKEFAGDEAVIKGGTSTPTEMTKVITGKKTPYYNPEREATLPGIRPTGVVEKCSLCDHRTKLGKLPTCVDACPADARIFGNLADTSSDVSKLIGKYKPYRLKEHLGTKPKVFYIRSFNPGTYRQTKGGI